MKLNSVLLLLISLSIAFLCSCRKEQFYGGSDARLAFSADTVFFDTVFTRLGGGNEPRSVNKRFTIRNPYKQTIRTNIRLAGGQASAFRINVDGIASLELNDFELRENDSAYVFVEVSIDPNNLSNPLIVQDSIVFTTNGNVQDIKLVAWGQDAYYYRDSVLSCNLEWNDATKPYVIYNSVLVREGCKLTIGPGVKVYSAVNSSIFVAGTLEVNGSKDQPVVFQGARLGQSYQNTPSQWRGIRLLTPSRNNKVQYAEIKNGIVGLQVDSLQRGGGFKLEIAQSSILNMSAGGLIGYTAWIRAENVVASNCGQYTFLGELGGRYLLYHCTFNNEGSVFGRSKPAFGLSNADFDDGQGLVVSNDLFYDIRNCIVWGGLREELVFFEGGSGNVTKGIAHTLLRTEIGGLNVNNNILNVSPRFKMPRDGNLNLDTLSPAKDKGMILTPPILIDRLGENRDASPDIGAFERKE